MAFANLTRLTRVASAAGLGIRRHDRLHAPPPASAVRIG